MPVSLALRLALGAAACAATLGLAPSALAQPGAQAKPSGPAQNSALDAPLFYQLIIGEMELRGGEPSAAFEILLDAARRTRDATLFRRAVDIALQGRALEQALAATRSWRVALPDSLDALRLQIQMLAAGGRAGELGEPVRALLRLTPVGERSALIDALPRFLQRGSDTKKVASVLSEVLKPFAEAAETRIVARVAIGRAWLNAGENAIALALARDAHQLDADAPGPAFLALELLPKLPAAEEIVTGHLARPGLASPVRLAYVRALAAGQQYAQAVRQLELATREKPEDATPFLTLGVLYIELKQPKDAETALLRYVALAQGAAGAAAAAIRPVVPVNPGSATTGADFAAPASDDEDDDEAGTRPARGLVQAWLALAQVSEQLGDFKAAEAWLARIDDPQRALEVQGRRASILARQGQVAQARELIRRTPERAPEDARAKLMAEASMLRDVKRWKEAFEVLAAANQRFNDDPDLLYEQAMVAEKTGRLEEMERLLRRVTVLKPESPHAFNALGYSLADRGQRLTEARTLIAKALELAPGDPFITDSLGWVEFRLGRSEEALRLLRSAYASRPDTEIGAHLGEVLWSLGQKDEARRVWREVRARDAANEVLRETLARLRAEP